MKVKETVTLLQKACRDYCFKHIKVWDYYAIASDAFQAGVRAGMEFQLKGTGNETIEIEREEGSHQIGAKMSGRKDLLTEQALVSRLEHDFNVIIDEIAYKDWCNGWVNITLELKKL